MKGWPLQQQDEDRLANGHMILKMLHILLVDFRWLHWNVPISRLCMEC